MIASVYCDVLRTGGASQAGSERSVTPIVHNMPAWGRCAVRTAVHSLKAIIVKAVPALGLRRCRMRLLARPPAGLVAARRCRWLARRAGLDHPTRSKYTGHCHCVLKPSTAWCYSFAENVWAVEEKEDRDTCSAQGGQCS